MSRGTYGECVICGKPADHRNRYMGAHVAVCTKHYKPCPSSKTRVERYDTYVKAGDLKRKFAELDYKPPKPPRPYIDLDMPMVDTPGRKLFGTKVQCITCSVTYRLWSPQLSPLESLSQARFAYRGSGWECPKCIKEKLLTQEAVRRNQESLHATQQTLNKHKLEN